MVEPITAILVQAFTVMPFFSIVEPPCMPTIHWKNGSESWSRLLEERLQVDVGFKRIRQTVE